MDRFEGRLAVVTGGGSGIGRELVLLLAAEGCSVAVCDIDAETATETRRLARRLAPEGTRVTSHQCDVSTEADVMRVRDEVRDQHATEQINLLINNAGVGGGSSFLVNSRAEWERTFEICWGGTYYCSRVFLPLVVASDAGHVVNVSSVAGFWGVGPPGIPLSAYSTAKAAIRGFSESLIQDLRVNAPHVHVSAAFPGNVGTSIVTNTPRIHGAAPEQDAGIREQEFRDTALTSATEAATAILAGVRKNQYRILVGDDAEWIDIQVRADPEHAFAADGPTIYPFSPPT